MSVYEMEDFTRLMEGWSDTEVSLTTLSDDLGQNVYSLKNENQATTTTGIFEEVMDSPIEDPLADTWMEQTSLSQMLEELTGMAVDNSSVPSAPVIEETAPVGSVDCSVFADLGLDQDGFELLQQLVEKATVMDSVPSFTPQIEFNEASFSGSGTVQVSPVISLDDSGISSLNTSTEFTDQITTIDTTDINDLSGSTSDVESILSSAPVSPSSSISSSDSSNCSELYKLMVQPTHRQSNVHRKSPYSSPSSSKKSKVKSVCTDSDSLDAHFMSKKDRKKLQNKNAAIRYRQKKKAEADEIKQEEDELEEKNVKLHEKVDELQREISYMKNLMAEVYKARGNIKVTKVTISH